MQEEIYNQYDEYQRHHKSLHDLVDGRVQEVFGALYVGQDHAGRQVAAYFVERPVYLEYDLVGIRAGGLRYHGVRSGMTACLTQHGIVHSAQLYVGHILQPQHVAVSERADDKIAVVLGILVAAPVLEHVLEGRR